MDSHSLMLRYDIDNNKLLEDLLILVLDTNNSLPLIAMASSTTAHTSGTTRVEPSEREKIPTHLLVWKTSQNLFQCGLCSMTFSTNKELVSHVKALSCIKPYQCGYCQVSYHASTKLLSHVKVHKLFLFVPVGNVSVSKSDSVNTGASPGFEVCEGNSSISSSCEMNTDSRETRSGSFNGLVASSGADTAGKISETQAKQQETVVGVEDHVNDERHHICVKTEHSEEDSAPLAAVVASTCKEEISFSEPSTQSPGDSDSGHTELSSYTEQSETCSSGRPKNHTFTLTERGKNTAYDSSVFQCGECDALFKGQSILSAHWNSQHGTCTFCTECFTSPRDRYEHYVTVHKADTVPNKPFCCVLCGSKFSVARSVSDHIRYKHNMKIKIKRRATPVTQAGPDPFQCGQCSAVFKSSPVLSAHWRSEHSACTVCGEHFSDPQERHQHIVTNHESAILANKPFVCAVCGAKFPLAKSVYDHLRYKHKMKVKRNPVSEDAKGTALICNSRTNLEQESEEMFQNGLDTLDTRDNEIDRSMNTSSSLCEHGSSDKHKEHGFKCGECDAVFASAPAIITHWKSQHSACTTCGECFSSPQERQQHILIHHETDTVPDRPFLCAVCGARFPLAQSVYYHIRYKHKIKLNKQRVSVEESMNNMMLCKTSTDSQGKYKKHSHGFETDRSTGLEAHSLYSSQKEQGCMDKVEELSLVCGECGAVFRSALTISTHWKSHHSACLICGCHFINPQNLLHHLREKHNTDTALSKPFLCAACGDKFPVARHLADHIECNHSFKHPKNTLVRGAQNMKRRGGTVNSVIHQKLKTSTKRQQKISTVAKDESGICPVCGKSVKNLKGHMLVHSDERPYTCSLCNKSYKSNPMLDVHMKTHTKERPYVCDVCGQSFALRNTLSYHVNSHTNARPYKCEICGKGFNCHSGKQKHRRIHTRDKRYTCEVCGKKFITSCNLKRHALTHTDMRPYSCNVCGKTFRSRSNIQYHMAHSHNRG